LLITFSNCSAKYRDRVLFDPEWGIYDMAVGERINSVFNGATDKTPTIRWRSLKERTIKVPSDAKANTRESLRQVRKIRETNFMNAWRNLGDTAG
jgi:phenylalanine-4-hydroxylase